MIGFCNTNVFQQKHHVSFDINMFNLNHSIIIVNNKKIGGPMHVRPHWWKVACQVGPISQNVGAIH
jgi:hypothetical protein